MAEKTPWQIRREASKPKPKAKKKTVKKKASE